MDYLVSSVLLIIVVYGCGGDKDTATKDDDAKLTAWLERCRSSGIVLNKKKMEVRKESVTFLGHIISHEGLKPDPDKITAILDMGAPKNRMKFNPYKEQ